MKKRHLGQTGLCVSELGLGTVKFGRNQGIKYPTPFELPDDNTLHNLLALAQDLGINLLDTAPAYGSSEERLGHLLRGQRQDWILISKAGEEFENGQSRFDFSAPHLMTSVERSLRRLRTDYLDLLLIHSDGQDLKRIHEDEVFETCHSLQKRGLIRSFGMSTKTLEGGLAAIALSDVAMVTYHPKALEEIPVIDAALAAQKGILVKKALESGHNASPADSLRFVLSNPGVSAAIVGTLNPDHLRANVLALA